MLDLLAGAALVWAVFAIPPLLIVHDRHRRGVKTKPVRKTGHWSGL